MSAEPFKSNEIAAGSYGMDYLFESAGAYEPEDTSLTVRRVAAMNAQVVQWIAQNHRIPTTNPNAALSERRMGHFLKALQFYGHIQVDPQDDCRAEREQNEMTHGVCQFAIRNGRFPSDSERRGEENESKPGQEAE